MLTRLFPLIAVLGAVIGYLIPDIISPAKNWIVPLLMVVMLSMGLSLSVDDFIKIKTLKKALAAGLILQFSIMPLTALAISKLFNLSVELTVGMLLVGSVAGGTASNVMTYLAQGNVALSVSMTSLSTLVSVLMTPLLMLLLVDSEIAVPAGEILKSLIMIIVIPVCIGITLNHFATKTISQLMPLLAPISIIVIAIIIATVVALNKQALSEANVITFIAPLLHNLTGLLLGYVTAKLLGLEKAICRTLAIEVGMQNSGLATVLALKFFNPISAIPGAIFSVWLNITGAIFAAFSKKDPSLH